MCQGYPNIPLGLENAGVTVGAHDEARVDKYRQAADGIWALGDLTGLTLFAQVTEFQSRIVANAILGQLCAARDGGTPRVVFSDPRSLPPGSPVAGRPLGLRTAVAEADLARAGARL